MSQEVSVVVVVVVGYITITMSKCCVFREFVTVTLFVWLWLDILVGLHGLNL